MKDDERKSWRQTVLHFTPSWFSVVMGTGIVAILLYDFPFQAAWLRYLSIPITCINLGLFLACVAISLARYVMYPGMFKLLLAHPVQSLFLGTVPMGMATLVSMLSNYSAHTHWAQLLAWAFRWLDVGLSLATATTLPFLIISLHKHSRLSEMTALWILPIVPCIVAAGTGATIARHFAETGHASLTHLTVWVSYILWGGGFFMASIVLGMYFQRLTLENLPPLELFGSVFLPLGPVGQGTFAILELASALRAYPPREVFFGDVGEVIFAVTVVISLMIWGFGLIWLFFALFSVTRRFPFNTGWWALTFPTGTYALGTIALGNALQSIVLRVFGAIFAVAVILVYCIVAVQTLRGLHAGKLIHGPCVETYQTMREANRPAPS